MTPQNATCVIIGAGPGVSMGVARRFGREGYRIALLARSPEKLNTFVDELQNAGISASAQAVDAADATSLAQALAQVGMAEVLVYNAAMVSAGKPSTLDPEALVDAFRVNVVGALAAAQAVIPDMKARGSGTILFTGGGLALSPNAEYAGLAIGKAGLRSLAYSLGQELEPDGIYVGTVTIAGFVQPGTHFDPDAIAEQYWKLHTERSEREFIYR